MSMHLSAQQIAALALVETRAMEMEAGAKTLAQLGAPALAKAYGDAIDVLKKAHEAFIHETQRAVSIASPGDMATALAGLVNP